MDRAAKRELVSTLHDVFKDTGVVVVAHYAGMTVAQMTDYRQKIKAAGGRVKVAKNRLAKLALEDTSSAGIANLFKGPTCVAYSKDPIAAAKVAVRRTPRRTTSSSSSAARWAPPSSTRRA